MTVRWCSVEAYPAHWIPSVTVWMCDACGVEATRNGWLDDPPGGWYCSLGGCRIGEVQGHCCSFDCTDKLEGSWTEPPIGAHPVYSRVSMADRTAETADHRASSWIPIPLHWLMR